MAQQNRNPPKHATFAKQNIICTETSGYAAQHSSSLNALGWKAAAKGKTQAKVHLHGTNDLGNNVYDSDTTQLLKNQVDFGDFIIGNQL